MARIRRSKSGVRRSGRLVPLVKELLDLFLEHVDHTVNVSKLVLWVPLTHDSLAFVDLLLKAQKRLKLVFYDLPWLLGASLRELELFVDFDDTWRRLGSACAIQLYDILRYELV